MFRKILGWTILISFFGLMIAVGTAMSGFMTVLLSLGISIIIFAVVGLGVYLIT